MDLTKKLLLIKELHFLNHSVVHGSYSKAAEKLGKKQSNLSKDIHSFEERIGVKCFSNVNHGVMATHEGLEINEKAKMIDGILYDIENYSKKTHCISGDIKLWTTDGIGICLMPYLTAFSRKYPDVYINTVCSNEMPSFTNRETDVAILYAEPKISEPVIVEKFSLRFGLYASASYVSAHGYPKDFDDLIMNHYISDRYEYSNTWNEWRCLIQRAKHVVSYTNSTNMLVQSTKSGLGIALHPINYAKGEPDLVPINVGFELEHPCYLVYHKLTENTEKIKALIQHIEQVLNQL